MGELFQYDFFINALYASILASIAGGVIGSFIVVRRIVFISGGIAHTAYGGIGLGYLLGFNPLLGALGFSVAAAAGISYMRTKHNQNEDTLIGIMWSFGMSLGIIFISLSPGYAADLMSYLFGNILTVPLSEIYMMLGINVIIITIVIIFFKQLQAVTFDEEYSRAAGIKVDCYYLLLFVLIALTIVVLIKLVGIILSIALLTIPSAVSKLFVSSLRNLILGSVVTGIILSVSGLFISYYLNLPTGSTIIILSVFGYTLVYIYKILITRRNLL
jgi:zinc transport system permease protein